MYVYLMGLHILSGEMSRSSFKVKGFRVQSPHSGYGAHLVIRGSRVQSPHSGYSACLVIRGSRVQSPHSGYGACLVIRGSRVQSPHSGYSACLVIRGSRVQSPHSGYGACLVIRGSRVQLPHSGYSACLVIRGSRVQSLHSGYGACLVIRGSRVQSLHSGYGACLVIRGSRVQSPYSGYGACLVIRGSRVQSPHSGYSACLVIRGSRVQSPHSGYGACPVIRGSRVQSPYSGYGACLVIRGSRVQSSHSGYGACLLIRGSRFQSPHSGYGACLVIRGSRVQSAHSGYGACLVIRGSRVQSPHSRYGACLVIRGSRVQSSHSGYGACLVIRGSRVQSPHSGYGACLVIRGSRVQSAHSGYGACLVIRGSRVQSAHSGYGACLVIRGSRVQSPHSGYGACIVIRGSRVQSPHSGYGACQVIRGSRVQSAHSGYGACLVIRGSRVQSAHSGYGACLLIRGGSRVQSPHSGYGACLVIRGSRVQSPHMIRGSRVQSPHMIRGSQVQSPHMIRGSRVQSPHMIRGSRVQSPHMIRGSQVQSPHMIRGGSRVQSAHSGYGACLVIRGSSVQSPHMIRGSRVQSAHMIRGSRFQSAHSGYGACLVIRGSRVQSPHSGYGACLVIRGSRVQSPHSGYGACLVIMGSRVQSPHMIRGSRVQSAHRGPGFNPHSWFYPRQLNRYLSDRNPGPRQPHLQPKEPGRHRVNSGDSASSHSSERSTGTEDKSLFNALKHRYQENAEKQPGDPSVRTPFSSWRRSGNFEEAMAASSPHDTQHEKLRTVERSSKTSTGSDTEAWKRDSFTSRHDNQSSSRSYSEGQGQASIPAPSPQGQSSKVAGAAEGEAHKDVSTDDLIFNFRQALRRHALSESEKKSETKTEKVDDKKGEQGVEEESTAQKLERLRAARAKIQEHRKSDFITGNAQSFATEFKSDKPDRMTSGANSSASSNKSDKGSAGDINVIKTDDNKHRQSTKLARQKLVSDDLKAKYIENRKDESEIGDKSVEDRDKYNQISKRDGHIEVKSTKSVDPKLDSESVKAEMLIGSTKEKTSVSKKFEKVDHSSPFGSVYSPKPSVTSVSASVSAPSASPLHKRTEIEKEKLQKENVENIKEKVVEHQKSETDTHKTKVQGKTEKRYKKYAKAKSLELGVLSGQKPNEIKHQEEKSKDDSVVLDTNADESQLARQERIAKYKEDRRRQLEAIQKKFSGGDGELPSLFLSSVPHKDSDSSISRSKSLKVEPDKKDDISVGVTRSKSLKNEKDLGVEYHPAYQDTLKHTGLHLAELGSQTRHDHDIYDSHDEKYDPGKLIDKIHAIKNMKIGHAEKVGSSREDSPNRSFERYGRDSDKSGSERDVGASAGSYFNRTLLAERAMDIPYRGRESPTRDRIRSSSRESENQDASQRYRPSDGVRFGAFANTEKGHDVLTDSSEASSVTPTSKRVGINVDDGRISKQKTGDTKSYFEFGTVYAKKEAKSEDIDNVNKHIVGKLEEHVKVETKKSESDSDRDRSDSFTRVRRKLPSVEEVLGKVSDSEKGDFMKEDLSKMSAEEIRKKKIQENIDRAKSRFKAEDKAGAFDASKFELGTVYSKKPEEKQSVSIGSKEKHVSNSDVIGDKKGNLIQQMLGVNLNDHEKVAVTSNVIEKTHYSKDNKPQFVGETREFKQGVSISTKDFERSEDKQVDRSNSGQDDKVGIGKPPSSPRNERKKTAEQKFGRVSYRSSEQPAAFEFGTSYTKKDSPSVAVADQKASQSVSKKIESPITTIASDLLNEERTKGIKVEGIHVKKPKHTSIQLKSQKSVEKEDGDKNVTKDILSPKQQSQVQFGIKAQAVSNASGQNIEVPTSPKSATGVSPQRFVSEPLKVSATSSAVAVSKPRGMSPIRAVTESSQISFTSTSTALKSSEPLVSIGIPSKYDAKSIEPKVEPHKSESKIISSEAKGAVVKETSVSKMEIKSPTSSISSKSETKYIEPIVEPYKSESKIISSEAKDAVVKETSVSKMEIKSPTSSISSKTETKSIEPKVEPHKSESKIISSEAKGAVVKQTSVSKIEIKSTTSSDKKVESVRPAEQNVKQISSGKGKHINEALFESHAKSEKVDINRETMKIIENVNEADATKIEKVSGNVKEKVKTMPQKAEKVSVEKISEIERDIHETKVMKDKDQEMKENIDKNTVSTDVQTNDHKTETSGEKKKLKPRPEPELTKFELMKRSVAEKVLTKPKPVEPLVIEKPKEKPHKDEKKGKSKEKRKKDKLGDSLARMKTSLMDTSLDDILSRNVDYLSDMEPANNACQTSPNKKSRPQSVIEPQKQKRRFKKTSGSGRSKSEDRSHFKVTDSDEDKESSRSKVAEDIPTSSVKVTRLKSSYIKHGSEKHDSESSTSSPATADDSQMSRGRSRSVKQSVSSESTGSQILLTGSQKVFSDHDQTGPKRTLSQNENQSAAATSLSHKRLDYDDYDEDIIRREAMDSVSEMSQSEVASGVGSDTSEMSDRKRFVTRGSKDEILRISDSDQSASSSVLSDSSRKKRKDKSSMRKSKLNESAEDAALSGPRRDSNSDDSSLAPRGGIRRVSSSRLARENHKDTSAEKEVPVVFKTHDLAHLSRYHNNQSISSKHPSESDSKLSQSSDKPFSNLESPRIGKQSLFETALPSRFALPSKVSATISKLTEVCEKNGGTEASPVAKKPEELPSRQIRRGNNFSQLLQKFSSSETSGSEKSDSESPRTRKILLRRQEACAVSSPSSDDSRRTPERTQSFKIKSTGSEGKPLQSSMDNPVQRSSSFKSSFMRSRFGPELDDVQKTTARTANQDDKPSPELASVLNRRSHIVAKQQEEGETIERQRIHDGKVERSDEHFAALDEEVIADSEVLSMLRSRRKETDAVSIVSDSDSRSQTHVPNNYVTSQTSSASLNINTSAETKLPLKVVTSSIVQSSQRQTSTIEKERMDHLANTNNESYSAKQEKQVQSQHKDISQDEPHDKTFKISGITSREILEEGSKAVLKSIKQSSADHKDSDVKNLETENRSVHTHTRGAIDINSKSEIMRKISSRDRTPERQTTKRAGPMKVLSPLSSTEEKPGLTRTESVGRTDSERPKGILKRTPSLKTSSVHVDPELAEVLKSRRQKHEDVDEEAVDQKLTAEEEIRQARERESQHDAAPQERELSVAERIFQMHTKIEEVKSCPITPRSYSGVSTPKSALHRSGNITPKNQLSLEEGNQSEISGTQLIERLTSLEGRQSNLAEKRSKFQQRKREDWRTRTQPVTLLEFQAADSLETVKKFRAEVLKRASTSVFEAVQKPEKAGQNKPTEFPQPFRKERRSRNQRHKTLPITTAELNAIPEGQASETMNSLKKKFEFYGAQDSKADSGILSRFRWGEFQKFKHRRKHR
ncbi:hypothetical protein DPMN_182051 [Dreissena polymorpha]|uniref:Uncharacterized protein n=1 Tax=Dreissena polymorpha TaxID=45954 RepID=A0A9D4I4Z9_DREPO|nr:hypothetical protein DPMN_182051 [Dreissena polymorpha]